MKLNVRMEEQNSKYKVKLEELSSVFASEMRDVQTITKIKDEPYEGEYVVTPNMETQVLLTEEKYLASNVIVNPIPHNYGLITWNGSILTVS